MEPIPSVDTHVFHRINSLIVICCFDLYVEPVVDSLTKKCFQSLREGEI